MDVLNLGALLGVHFQKLESKLVPLFRPISLVHLNSNFRMFEFWAENPARIFTVEAYGLEAYNLKVTSLGLI